MKEDEVWFGSIPAHGEPGNEEYVPAGAFINFNGMEVVVMHSAIDGKPLVQIVTESAEEQDIRITLNDGDIWDQSTEEPWKNGRAL